MTIYVARPNYVEARQVTRHDAPDIATWCGGELIHHATTGQPAGVAIPTADGWLNALAGDWVVRLKRGAFERMTDSTFNVTYEAMEPAA